MSQDPQKNMAVIQHWFNTVNGNDVTEMVKEGAEIIADDYVIHDPGTPDLQPGAANYLKQFEQDMAGSADRKVTMTDLFAVDDKVIGHGVYEFLDLASNERKKVAAMVISRFEGGKIKEEWQILAPFAGADF